MKMQFQISGTGKPIVLVPGGLTGWASWEPFERIFSPTRTVIRVQLLGVQFGLEDVALPADYSVKKESSALSETLESLYDAQPLDVVAWSFGALTALDYALDHPDRIGTLTLIEPPAMWVLRETGKWTAEIEKLEGFFRTFHGDISENMLAGFLENAGFIQHGESAESLPQWNTWLGFRRSLRINPFAVEHSDSAERLRNFTAPVLLVKGTGSTPWLHEVIDGIHENIPNSKIVEFPGGHAPHLVSRDAFLTELALFQAPLQPNRISS